nr:hypothetical protein OG781_23225 [Streptomyces sp. NBC_00830]
MEAVGAEDVDIGVLDLDIEAGQGLERCEVRRRRPLPARPPIVFIPGLCKVKLSNVPAYGLDDVPVRAGASHLEIWVSQHVSWDGLGAWTGLTSLCVRALALSLCRRTSSSFCAGRRRHRASAGRARAAQRRPCPTSRPSTAG